MNDVTYEVFYNIFKSSYEKIHSIYNPFEHSFKEEHSGDIIELVVYKYDNIKPYTKTRLTSIGIIYINKKCITDNDNNEEYMLNLMRLWINATASL